jgi:hypothetical protein
MTFSQALVLIMWANIMQEVPAFRQEPDSDTAKQYKDDIARMVAVDDKVASLGYLVEPETDRVLIGSMRWFEARYQSKPKDGDCIRNWHPYRNVPSGRWPQGYVPVFKTKCPAKGPMQISEGNLRIMPAWQEVRSVFADIKPWQQQVDEHGVNPWKLQPASIDELRDPEVNVRFGYSALWHWKNTCTGRRDDPRSTPAGVWMTAWGWGKCPPPSRRTVGYVDREGRRRCDKATTMMKRLVELARSPQASFDYTLPDGWYCGHEKRAKPE